MKHRRWFLKVFLSILIFAMAFMILKQWPYYPVKLQIIRPSDEFLTKFDETAWKPTSFKKILLWTKEFRSWAWLSRAQEALPTCKQRCVVTKSRNEINSSDAVLFHCEDIWQNRRSLNSLVFNSLNELPTYRHPSQVWVFWSLEPVSHTYGIIPRDLFNWTALYRRDSTIFIPYEDRLVKKSEKEINGTVPVAYYERNFFKDKTKMAVIVESNCADQSRRYRLVGEISKYIHVDQFGECVDNVICHRNRGREECDKYIMHYKFYLAFENSFCQDYVTEKFWRSLTDRHQIPVIAASNATTELLPPNSYLNVFDFPSIKALTSKMKEIANNETLYNSFFSWMPYYKRDDEHAFCKLCTALHENRTAQVYHD